MSATPFAAIGQPAGLATHVALIEHSVQGIDRKLGYYGQARFVIFYYEPRGQEVIWQDSHCYGFASGAWQFFIEDLSRIADLHQADVGSSGSPGKDVLLTDRSAKRAYFMERKKAIRFLLEAEEQRLSEMLMPLVTQFSSVEITRESIAENAYHLWEKAGRLEGRALQYWLQAEAATGETVGAGLEAFRQNYIGLIFVDGWLRFFCTTI